MFAGSERKNVTEHSSTISPTLKSLFERIINNDPAQIFRGYQPVVVQGEPGIRIIIDKDAISQAIKEKRIKKADVLPYIQEFTKTGLNEAIKDLDFDVNTYISEVELEKLTNDWIKIKNGQSFIDNFSKDTRTTTEGGDRTNIYNLAKQLTQFFARFLQEESTAITDTTIKITKIITLATKKDFSSIIWYFFVRLIFN